MRNSIIIRRLPHHPPQFGKIDEGTTGVGADTDYGNLTILARNDVSGLRVMNRDDQWIASTPISGSFVITILDFIQKLANHKYLAHLSSVVNTSGRERYSIPFFISAVFVPLKSSVTADNQTPMQPPAAARISSLAL